MKVKVACKTCGSIITVKRFCKKIDGLCYNIEDTGDKWDFVPWCKEPCSRKEGPLLSKKQLKLKKEKEDKEQLRLEKLRKKYGKKCPHPEKEQFQYDYEYLYGDIFYYRCKICGFKWKKWGPDSRGTSHDYGLDA